MKVTLEFNLPEEHDEYETAMNGQLAAISLEEIDNALRAVNKYDDFSMFYVDEFEEGTLSESDIEIIQRATSAIRRHIGIILENNGLA